LFFFFVHFSNQDFILYTPHVRPDRVAVLFVPEQSLHGWNVVTETAQPFRSKPFRCPGSSERFQLIPSRVEFPAFGYSFELVPKVRIRKSTGRAKHEVMLVRIHVLDDFPHQFATDRHFTFAVPLCFEFVKQVAIGIPTLF
jgi:hypothetical protein